MITFAKKNDINNIIKLWNICFNENQKFTKWFFDNIYKEKYTLIYKENNKIISMLQMLPITFNNYNITYIYGACTSPIYQKRGFMKQLLLKSFNIDKNINNIASILIPKNETLFKFYKKFGYEKNIYISKKILYYNSSYVNNLNFKFKKADIHDLTNIKFLYDNYKYSINRNFLYIKKQFYLFTYMKNHIYCLYQNSILVAYAYMVKENNNFVIQELIGNIIIAYYIMKLFSLNKILVYAPVNENNYIYKIPNCSIKIHDSCNKDIQLLNYFNLAFN